MHMCGVCVCPRTCVRACVCQALVKRWQHGFFSWCLCKSRIAYYACIVSSNVCLLLCMHAYIHTWASVMIYLLPLVSHRRIRTNTFLVCLRSPHDLAWRSVYACIFTFTHIFLPSCEWLCTCRYVYMHVCMHACVFVSIRLYIDLPIIAQVVLHKVVGIQSLCLGTGPAVAMSERAWMCVCVIIKLQVRYLT